MKDSGIEWIGEIPEDWEVCKIKHILSTDKDNLKVGPFGSQLSGTDFSTEGYWVYNQRTVLDYNFETNNTYVNYVKYEEMQGFQVRENDILITTRGTIGKIARVPKCFKKGILHPCIIKFRIDDTKYDYNLLEIIFNDSNLLKLQIDYESNATTIDVIYGYTLKNLVLPFPPLHEQQKITDFLDKKCSEIDSVISKTRETIEEYKKLKQSILTEVVTGKNEKVEGKSEMLPDGWEWIKLKYLVKYNVSTLEEKTNDDFNFDYIDIGSVEFGKGITDFQNMNFKNAPSRARRILEEGDVILSTVRTYLRAIAKINKRENPQIASTGFVVLTADKSKILSEYLFYAISSETFISKVESNSVGISYPAINSSQVVNFKVPVPPLTSQLSLISYLDQKCSEIDNLITKKEQLVVELEAYKKSLIYEVVTGKREM